MLLTDKEIMQARLENTGYHPMSQHRCVAKAQLKKAARELRGLIGEDYKKDFGGYVNAYIQVQRFCSALLKEAE